MKTGSSWAAKASGVSPGTFGGASLPGWDCEGLGSVGGTVFKMAAHLGPHTAHPPSVLRKQPTRQLPVAGIATPNVFVPRVCEIPRRHRSSPT